MKRKIKLINLQNNNEKIFNSMKEAGNYLKCSASNIKQVLMGNNKTCKKHFAQYYDPDLLNETWKFNHHRKLNISTKSRIQGRTGKTLGSPDISGYMVFHGANDNKLKVHRIILETYDPIGEIITMYQDYDNKPEGDHIDGNKHNNDLDNLEWVTRGENQKRFIALKKYKQIKINYLKELLEKIRKYPNINFSLV